MTEALTFVHAGAFSGSAYSLREALRERVSVRDVDLMPLSRRPGLAAARVRAVAEARRAGGVPWTKTGAWSAGLQRHLRRHRVIDPELPMLVVQSLPAFDLPLMRYAVYTDRVGLEGAGVGGVHSSRFSASWLDRETRFLRRADRVFVMGPSTKAVLVQDYGCDADRVEVVGAGPNTRLGPVVRREACRRLLFVGTQWELKGGPTLLEAFARLRRIRPELELLLVGSGPATVPPAGVTVAGRVPHSDMAKLYDTADLLVMPTHMEAFGIALVEGLIKGLPCVCSSVGNQPWIVGDAGEVVDPGDVSALVDALERMVSDFAAYHARAVQRGAELRRTMSWSVVAARIVNSMDWWPHDAHCRPASRETEPRPDWLA